MDILKQLRRATTRCERTFKQEDYEEMVMLERLAYPTEAAYSDAYREKAYTAQQKAACWDDSDIVTHDPRD